jgi:hypothetical protein
MHRRGFDPVYGRGQVLIDATCDNTDDVLAIDPRPGNATSNCALLDLAVSRLPGRYRRRGWCAWTGPGSHTSCSTTSPQAAG